MYYSSNCYADMQQTVVGLQCSSYGLLQFYCIMKPFLSGTVLLPKIAWPMAVVVYQYCTSATVQYLLHACI